MDGVINVYKPAGWTSQDVCAKLRSRLHIKKIGHTGTLDPMATGVLPVCIGKATRIIEYYDRDRKAYHASMKLGIMTDTLDITGEILETNDHTYVSEDAVIEAFRAYTGVISQVPPKYSALKINGKRAYELAREGREFELQAREIEIYGNRVTRLALGAGEIEFDVECSKGTYIRSMIADIGRSLGCGAVMTALERTASGCFKVEDAADLDELVSIIDAAYNNKAGTSQSTGNQPAHLANDETTRSPRDQITLHTNVGTAKTTEDKTLYRINNGTMQSSNETTWSSSNEATQQPTAESRSQALKKLESIVITADETLINLGKILLNDNRVTAFLNGNSSHVHGYRTVEASDFDELYRVYARPYNNDPDMPGHGSNGFLGIGRIIEGELVPQKVFR